MKNLDRATRCVRTDHRPGQGIVAPIHTSTAYHSFGEENQPYPRYSNTPNQNSLAQKIADLEGAERGEVFGSGMAAVSTTVLSLLKPGDHVLIQRGLYGGTHAFLLHEFAQWNIAYEFISTDLDEFRGKVRPNTRFVLVESPTICRYLEACYPGFIEIARETGVITIIDNTLASPIHQNPIEYGFDLVLHSGTKYLGGHSDLSAGAVVGSAERIDTIRKGAARYGGMLDPLACHWLDRSLKTLDVRVQRQTENAQAIAEFLEGHEHACGVRYPGLPSHPGHTLAASQMRGFGGMIAFEIAPDRSPRALLEAFQLITPALSFGGVETTISIPALSANKEMSEADRQACGVTSHLFRFSVGIEKIDDLIGDLDRALTPE